MARPKKTKPPETKELSSLEQLDQLQAEYNRTMAEAGHVKYTADRQINLLFSRALELNQKAFTLKESLKQTAPQP